MHELLRSLKRRRSRLAILHTVAVHRWLAALGVTTVILLASCSSSGRSGSEQDSTLSPDVSSRLASSVDLGPLPADLEAARSWSTENDEAIGRFVSLARELLQGAPKDCDGLAERLEDALGQFSGHLRRVGGSPDPVLGELLTSAAIATRLAIAACVSNEGAVIAEERNGLRNALLLIERRQNEIES